MEHEGNTFFHETYLDYFDYPNLECFTALRKVSASKWSLIQRGVAEFECINKDLGHCHFTNDCSKMKNNPYLAIFAEFVSVQMIKTATV